jgi:hypothetical protein
MHQALPRDMNPFTGWPQADQKGLSAALYRLPENCLMIKNQGPRASLPSCFNRENYAIIFRQILLEKTAANEKNP